MEVVQSDKTDFSGRIKSLRDKLHRVDGFVPVENITPVQEQKLSIPAGCNKNTDVMEL